MDMYGDLHQDWNSIIQNLKSEDEFSVYQGAMQLRDQLNLAQEN